MLRAFDLSQQYLTCRNTLQQAGQTHATMLQQCSPAVLFQGLYVTRIIQFIQTDIVLVTNLSDSNFYLCSFINYH